MRVSNYWQNFHFARTIPLLEQHIKLYALIDYGLYINMDTKPSYRKAKEAHDSGTCIA